MNQYVLDHQGERVGARRSAETIVPILQELFHPSSAVDVGCGVGAWLSVLNQKGVKEILGIDGSYVECILEIPRDCFMAADLKDPPDLNGRQFDLVISLEVAEHLPQTNGPEFVRFLTSLGPVVLFSAAIPFQIGTDHQNLQWPKYWASCFERHGYAPLDVLRMKTWENDQVDWWYSQNMVLYVKERIKDLLSEENRACVGARPISLIHPTLYVYNSKRMAALEHMIPGSPRLSKVLSRLPFLLLHAITSRLLRICGVRPGSARQETARS